MCDDAAQEYARFRRVTAHLTGQELLDLAEKLERLKASGFQCTEATLRAPPLTCGPRLSKAGSFRD